MHRGFNIKNILILASGSVAKHFIHWVSQKRVADNKYYVTCYNSEKIPAKLSKNIVLIEADPTSYSKLSNIMQKTHFSNVFIVVEDSIEAKYILKNIELINKKIRTVLVNLWDEIEIEQDLDNLTLIHSDELMAAHLYDQLPNVPLVAQNVGLGRGEIMEVHIPFGSAYAYRHVGSILQRKWKISAIYRNEKQILPTPATMIRPNDRLLILGKPLVLNGVYKTINKRMGLFPEPYGKNIYLLLDFRYDKKKALRYIEESIYLLKKLDQKLLYVRILYPNDFVLIDKLKTYESENIIISVSYEESDVRQLIEYDIHQHDIGLIINSIQAFESDSLKDVLYVLRKLVYLFGDKLLYNVKKSVVIMTGDEKMESISATAFDISESLNLPLMLGDFDPEGDFESKKMIVEHYETLTHIFNMKIDIEQKVANPIRELSNMQNILQIAPFEKKLNTDSFIKFISTRVQDFLLITSKHPKLLVPFALNDTKEES